MSTTSQSRPSVLFIGVGTPWMGGAGYLVRQNMLLKALAGLNVDLHLGLFDPETDAPAPPFDAQVTALPSPVRITEQRWRSLLNDFIRGDPMLLRTMDCRAAREAVARLQPSRFDAVVAYRCDFAYAAGVLDHSNLILDIDDPEHLRRTEAAQWTDDGNAAWQRRWDLRRLKRFEIKCARHAEACFVCQPRDAIPFREAGLEPVIVPNCVDVGETCPTRNADSKSILFVGNMEGSETSPNVDGLRWLVRDVWPLIRQQASEAQCLIAGPIRKQWREEIANVPGVRVLGFVDDLASLLGNASVSVAPIRFGTGTRIKILEAMAAGCPVVSTTKGCEGIEVENHRDIRIADAAHDFAAACVDLLRDAPQAARIGRAGWQVVFDRYNRSRRRQWLSDVLAALIGANGVRSVAGGEAGGLDSAVLVRSAME